MAVTTTMMHISVLASIVTGMVATSGAYTSNPSGRSFLAKANGTFNDIHISELVACKGFKTLCNRRDGKLFGGDDVSW